MDEGEGDFRDSPRFSLGQLVSNVINFLLKVIFSELFSVSINIQVSTTLATSTSNKSPVLDLPAEVTLFLYISLLCCRLLFNMPAYPDVFSTTLRFSVIP